MLAPYHYLTDLSTQPFAKREPAGLKVVTHVNGQALLRAPRRYSGIGAIYNMGTLAKLGVSATDDVEPVLALCTKAKAAGSPHTRSASRTPG